MEHAVLDSYAFVRFAEEYRRRLEQADNVLSQEPGLLEEKRWLRTAQDRLSGACGNLSALFDRVYLLPELVDLRVDHASGLLSRYVDALEALRGGISARLSRKSPVLEALFPNLTSASLFKASRDSIERYARDIEKRTQGSYVKRMMVEPELAFVPPLLDAVRDAYSRWDTVFTAKSLEGEQASDAAKLLTATAHTLEMPLLQARLLAEAALAPVGRTFRELGLDAKPPRRREVR